MTTFQPGDVTDPRAYLADVLADLVEVRATWALDDELLIGSQAELASMSATVGTLARALIAVLDKHGRDEFGECDDCMDFAGNGVLYPCPTVTAITTELAKEEA